MKTKNDTVDISRLHPDLKEVLPFVEAVYNTTLEEMGVGWVEMVVTSGHELTSKHGVGSKHYTANNESGLGEAVDIRCNLLNGTQGTEMCGMIARHLRLHYPGRFKCFFEGCLKPEAHCHIQLA